MNQFTFNEIVTAYIDMQSAASVMNFLAKNGWPLQQAIYDAAVEINKLQIKVIKKQAKIQSLDDEIYLIYNNEASSDNFSEKVELLSVKKSLVLFEILAIENKIQILEEKIEPLLYSTDFYHYSYAVDNHHQSREKLKRLLKPFVPENPDFPELFDIVTRKLFETIYSRSIEISEEINKIVNSAFEFYISYEKLINKIVNIISVTEWEDTAGLIQIKQVLAQRNSMNDVTLYQHLQQVAKEHIRDDWGKIAPLQGIDSFYRALILTDLSELEAWIKLDDVLGQHLKSPFDELPKEHIEFALIDERVLLTSNELHFTRSVDNYLQLQAANAVLQEIIPLVEPILIHIKSLEDEILQLQTTIEKQTLKLEDYHAKCIERDIYYKKSIEQYPHEENFFVKSRDKEMREWNEDIRKNDINLTQIAMYETRKKLNTFISQNMPQIYQAITLSQFIKKLHSHSFATLTNFLKNELPNADETLIVTLAEICESKEKLLKGNFAERLNHYLNNSCHFFVSYKQYNQLIINLVNHKYWEAQSKRGVGLILLDKLKNVIVSSAHLSPPKLLGLIEKTIHAFGNNKAPVFFDNSIPNEMNDFFQAILNQDISLLKKLSIQFNFIAELEECKVIGIRYT